MYYVLSRYAYVHIIELLLVAIAIELVVTYNYYQE